MIAKIGHGASITGALKYNLQKVLQENGTILFLNRMSENTRGKYSLRELTRSFDPYLAANRRTENPAVHISLNPDPRDRVSDGQYVKMAEAYMREMGYGDQPMPYSSIPISVGHTSTSSRPVWRVTAGRSPTPMRSAAR